MSASKIVKPEEIIYKTAFKHKARLVIKKHGMCWKDNSVTVFGNHGQCNDCPLQLIPYKQLKKNKFGFFQCVTLFTDNRKRFLEECIKLAKTRTIKELKEL
jgi:hypothetical protein